MVWGKAGYKTLTVANATISLTGLPTSNFNQFLQHSIPNGSEGTEPRIKINNDSAGHANRMQRDGGNDSVANSRGDWVTSITDAPDDNFIVTYMSNFDGKEKIGMSFTVQNSGGTATPRRRVVTSTYTDGGTNAKVTQVDATDTATDKKGIGANFSALGDDVTPQAGRPTNVQVGSRFEETDTRKMYHYEVATPTKDYDMTTDPRTNTFDTSGVTTITHANSTLQLNQLNASGQMGAATYIDLGSALSTKWVMRFRTKQSAYTSYMYNSQFQVGMSSVAPTSTAYNISSSLNWIGFRWYFGTQFSAPYVGIEPRIQQNAADNTHSNTNARLYGKPNETTNTTTSYYHEFIWNIDTFTYNLYDNANYTGTKLATATMSSSSNTHWVDGTPSSISGLQYLVFKMGSDSNGGVWVNQLDDVQIWDGVIVPATGNAWTEEGT